jgi:O-acetyl-ADP-ribose deacetylase (regulator of RNase III)
MEFTTGNILNADTEAIVNTVNCVGVMGRGIAAQFKREHPANFKLYQDACKRGQVVPGRMLVAETGRLTNPRFIINFPTKRHWKSPSRIEDIEAGIVALVAVVQDRRISSIAIPPLGCGLGGLDWATVRALLEQAFSKLPIRTVLFEPIVNEDVRMSTSQPAPTMTPGRAVLVGLIERYLNSLLDPSISLLEVHKMMYFAQEAGEPLRLRFRKAPYGPYAENLRHVLMTIEGYMVRGYGDGGDTPSKALHLVDGAADAARETLDAHPETLERFERVARLVDGFETSHGMELLATVHWVMAQEGARGAAVVDAVHQWNERKKRFTIDQVNRATQRLAEQGWSPMGDVPTPSR